MLDNGRQEVLANNYFLNKVKDGRKKIKFDRDGMAVFVIAIIISLAIIVGLYIISPYSKTFKVTVEGNHYLKEEDIVNKANLSKYFLLTNPKEKEAELLSDPLIEEATISMHNGNIVSIEIKEVKQIGYILEDGESKLLLINDDRVTLNKDNLYLIDKVPLIEGYTKEELTKIEKGFENVDYKVINEISEIHKYPISYDNEQMEVIMRDGNYCFMSSTGLHLLENYYSISSAIDSSKGYACAYFDDLTNSAYISTCPWQIEEVQEELSEEEISEELS